MFVKLTRSGPRTYVQLVESFRDETGKPRQRTLLTLGRLDQADGQVDAVINALLRAKGRTASHCSAPQIRFESALALGDVWVLDELWRELGFDRLAELFHKARFTTDIEQAVRVMVFNRLCD
ncbi:MAG: IS1634 family transposase, partial [Betaproteobacteria bacterium]|nr:IS1634 family transposase [Betaproteobacteria bacterium]NDI23845.1 IS1634 family transposase [Betaproteobacteria bacterium]